MIINNELQNNFRTRGNKEKHTGSSELSMDSFLAKLLKDKKKKC